MLGALKSALGGEVFEVGKQLISKVIEDPNKRRQAEMELKRIAADREGEMEKTLRQGMEMTADIIESEMKSGDNFTKRARPMLVYWGMGLITIREVANYFTGGTVPVLPQEFWMAWGGVVSVWCVGRSAEKFTSKKGGEPSSLVKKITG